MLKCAKTEEKRKNYFKSNYVSFTQQWKLREKYATVHKINILFICYEVLVFLFLFLFLVKIINTLIYFFCPFVCKTKFTVTTLIPVSDFNKKFNNTYYFEREELKINVY